MASGIRIKSELKLNFWIYLDFISQLLLRNGIWLWYWKVYCIFPLSNRFINISKIDKSAGKKLSSRYKFLLYEQNKKYQKIAMEWMI